MCASFCIFVLMHIYTLGVRQYSNEFGIALTYRYICVSNIENYGKYRNYIHKVR